MTKIQEVTTLLMTMRAVQENKKGHVKRQDHSTWLHT